MSISAIIYCIVHEYDWSTKVDVSFGRICRICSDSASENGIFSRVSLVNRISIRGCELSTPMMCI